MAERDPNDVTTTSATPAPAPNPWSTDEETAARQWANNYITQHQIPVGYGNAQSLVDNYFQQRKNGVGHEQAMSTVPGLLGWDQYKAAGGDPGGTGGTGGVDPGTTTPGLGSLFQPFDQTYTKPNTLNLGGPAGIDYIPPVPGLNLPNYEKPPAFQYKDFELPDLDAVYADPSFKLRRDEGQRGIEASAAAKGRVRTGGNLMDILKYNQGFASSEYGNIVDRKLGQYRENRGNALDTYNTNYKSQYTDPYAFNEESAKAAFAPLFSQWTTQAAAGQRQNELNADQGWAQFLQKYREFDDQRKFKYGALSDQQRIGLDAASR